MKISYIINTASRDAWQHGRGNPWRVAGYSERYTLLKDKVLPAALPQGFDETIVAGIFEEGAHYRYVMVLPRCRDRRDALWQRELGARHATGDILVFSHDDHMLHPQFLKTLRAWIAVPPEPWDLLIPKRVHGVTGKELNNGKQDDYMGGHVLVMKRWLWAEIPWTSVDTEFWDTTMTRLWRQAGGKLVYADDLVHIDVEAKEDET